jgi:hypothetical protein
MSYVRKTRDEWEVQGDYGHGWECVTGAETYKEALQYLREYRDNEGGTYRLKAVRVKIDE